VLGELIFLLPAKLVEEASSRRPVGQGYGCLLQLGGGGGGSGAARPGGIRLRLCLVEMKKKIERVLLI